MANAIPETKYVVVGDADVAYQVIGDGPLDLVCAMGSWSNIALIWEYPPMAEFLTKLASFSRLILLDRRGKGASDGLAHNALPTWENWTEDVRAVLDAVESKSAAILAEGEAGTIAILFAAMQPERVHSLVLANTSPRMTVAEDYPIGLSHSMAEQCVAVVGETWGTPASVHFGNPLRSQDPEFVHQMTLLMRSSQTPRTAAAMTRYIMESIDVRHALPLVHVPTLVLHNNNPLIPLDHGRYIASHIEAAKFVAMTGDGTQLLWDPRVADEVAEFLTGEAPEVEIDRILTTVLFTDIVGSTAQVSTLGDKRWLSLRDAHNRAVRDELRRFRGREIGTTGDGFVASFDGPARAIRCARAIVGATKDIGVDVRAGMHTGECNVRGDDLSGLAVHIAARVGALAEAGEVLVSRTVVDLVAGSEIQFADRGEYQLKGVPGTWRLFAGQSSN